MFTGQLPWGAATGAGLCVGCLNFVLTAEVDGGADITSFTLSNFSPGGTMDAGYNTELGTGVETHQPEASPYLFARSGQRHPRSYRL
jgi:hypothetical protein